MQLIIDLKIYPKQAVLKTCYALINKGYFFLKTAPKEKILVEFEAKDKKKQAAFKAEFMNALIYNSVRVEVFQDQKNIIEAVVQRALSSAAFSLEALPAAPTTFQNDPKGISKTWEEAHAQEKTAKIPGHSKSRA